MGVITLRPDATAFGGGWTIGGGAPSHNAAVADDTDATYVSASTRTAACDLDLPVPALPALSQLRSVTPRVRASEQDALNGLLLAWRLRSYAVYGDPAWNGPWNQVVVSATITTFTGGSIALTQAFVDALKVQLTVDPALDVRVHAVYVDVAYNEAPVVSAVTPSGGTVTTTRPAIRWTYTDPENDPQERYRVKVFSAAQYGASGFNPETSTAAYDSGEVLSSATAHTLATHLADNTTYKAYVKAADAGSGGRYGAWADSPEAFITDIDEPATPTLTATADAALARVTLTVQGRDNLLTTNQASIETDTTGWVALQGCTIARSTAQASHGVASLAATGNGAAVADARPGTSQGLAGVAVVAGSTYTFLASVRAATTARTVEVHPVWWTSAGAFLAYGTMASAVDSTSAWTQIASTVVAPAGAAFASVEVRIIGGQTSGEVHYVDKISVAPGSSSVWTRGGIGNWPTPGFYVERSTDSGVTWQLVRSTDAVRRFPGEWRTVVNDLRTTAYDHEMARGLSAIYRVHVISDPSEIPGGITSLWSATTPAVTVPLDDNWWLKDPLDPARNAKVAVPAPLETERLEDQAVKRPLGRTRPVVLRGALYGESGTLPVECVTQAEFDAVELLRSGQRTLLLQSPLGDHRYVALGETRRSSLVAANADARIRNVAVAFVEVDAPPP